MINTEHGDDAIRDMYFASVLLSYGGQLIEIDRSDPRRQAFYFDMSGVREIWISNGDKSVIRFPNPSISDIQLHYTSKTLWLPPEYPNSLRSIKSAIHNQVLQYAPTPLHIR